MPVRDGSGLKPVGSMRGQSLFKCYRLTAAIDGLHEGKNGAPPLANPASGMAARRFPPPWTIDEMNNVCFIVRDKNGQQLGYFYFEEESGRRTAANMLTKDEARRLAVNFAKLPELLGKRS